MKYMFDLQPKIIVFDLDETLGYFQELCIFIDAIEFFLNAKISQNEFNEILDLYPEFLRPDILDILDFIKLKKDKTHCKLMIYTNNQRSKEWVIKIKNYFDYKLNGKLFDHVIAAFKINGKHLELCRTSHDKSYSDFIKCTKLPKETKICFIDDQMHEGMKHDNVYYVKVKPYVYMLDFKIMIERYLNQFTYKITSNSNYSDFYKLVFNYINSIHFEYNTKSSEEQQIDKIVGKRILQHLNAFLTIHKNKTKKYSKNKNSIKTNKNKTLNRRYRKYI